MNNPPRILLACPQHETKEYAFQRWLDGVAAFKMPNVDVMLVDNSEDAEFYERWRKKAQMVRFPVMGPRDRRIAMSMEFIRLFFLTREYEYWWCLESDMLAPPYTLSFLLAHIKNADWVSLPYLSRDGRQKLEYSFGCSMWTRRLMEAVDFSKAPWNETADGWLKNSVERSFRIKIVQSSIELEHLKE